MQELSRLRFLAVWLAFVACLLLSAPVRAAGASLTHYAIVIGHNEAPASLHGTASALSPLRYADDDAARVYRLLKGVSQRAYLLAVLDADTQRRFPDLVRASLAPRTSEIERAVDSVREAVERDVQAGKEPSVTFFFSGHGFNDGTDGAALSILDGSLTRRWLYEKLLARIPARFIHLIVDACHAEAVVRPRDVDAKLEPLSSTERERYVEEATLAQFPNVGVVLAASASARSFEWDGYQGGVFVHELLSGLYGGADVNGDESVEYSEIAAFLTAANLRVADPRARLSIVVEPPRSDRRAPLLHQGALPGHFRLVGRAEGVWSQPFFIETETGQRLLDVYAERGATIALRLPARERLFVVRRDAEARLSASEGELVTLASLRGVAPRTRPRGSLAMSMERGLFGTRFGPAFYHGYVSERESLVAVPFSPEVDESPPTPPPSTEPAVPAARRTIGMLLLGAAGAATITAGIFTAMTLDARAKYESTTYEAQAEEAREQYYSYRTTAWASAGAAVALGVSGTFIAFYPEPSKRTASGPRLHGLGVAGPGLTTWGSF
jgi:hypothetical protein